MRNLETNIIKSRSSRKKGVGNKKAGESIDGEKYGKVVDEVVGEFKSDLTVTKDGMEKLSKYLKKDWEKMKKAIA